MSALVGTTASETDIKPDNHCPRQTVGLSNFLAHLHPETYHHTIIIVIIIIIINLLTVAYNQLPLV